MTARKKPSDQDARQAAPGADQARQDAGQDAPGTAPGTPNGQAGPVQPDQAENAQNGRQAERRGAVPGAPRNYQLETRTYEQAVAEAGPDGAVWPWPMPVHGVAGFSQLAGWKEQHQLGGEIDPADMIGDEPGSLLILISWAKYMGRCPIEQEALIAEHDEFGRFYLRCVTHPTGGYLIGIVDDQGATYGGCEWYDELDDAREAWPEWARVCAL